jgi:hypothetical protein
MNANEIAALVIGATGSARFSSAGTWGGYALDATLLVKLLFGCPKTLQLGNPSLCRSLCWTGEHDAWGLIRLGDLNSIAHHSLRDDPIAWLLHAMNMA